MKTISTRLQELPAHEIIRAIEREFSRLERHQPDSSHTNPSPLYQDICENPAARIERDFYKELRLSP